MESAPGGSAVATPSASSTPAVGSATPSSTGAAPAGIFDHIQLTDTAPAAEPQINPDPLAGAATATETPAGAGEGAQPASDTLPKPFMGRWKTFTEAEEAYKRTQTEAQRLWMEARDNKAAHDKVLQEKETRLRQLEADLEDARTHPPFKELSSEELQALKKEDPGAFADYMVDKKFRDRDLKASKEKREWSEKQSQERKKEVLAKIVQEDNYMAAHPEVYPQHRELMHVQRQFIERTKIGEYSPLTGHPWTTQVLYYISLGFAHHQALIKGGKTQADAAKTAEAKAAADAAAGRGPGASAPGNQPEITAGTSDADFNKALIGAAPRRLFGK